MKLTDELIDTHFHIWGEEFKKMEWLKNENFKIIDKAISIDEYLVFANTNHLSNCIMVQSLNSYMEIENYVNAIAKTTKVLGIVLWLDFDNLNEFHSVLENNNNQNYRNIVGVRNSNLLNIQRNSPLSLKNSSIMNYLLEMKLPIDVLAKPTELHLLQELIDENPNNIFVLDHAGKPGQDDLPLDKWFNMIKELGNYRNLYCKISGMTPLYEKFGQEVFEDSCEHIFESFSSDRIVYGSDWPVCTITDNFFLVEESLRNILSKKSISTIKNFKSLNAKELYGVHK